MHQSARKNFLKILTKNLKKWHLKLLNIHFQGPQALNFNNEIPKYLQSETF